MSKDRANCVRPSATQCGIFQEIGNKTLSNSIGRLRIFKRAVDQVLWRTCLIKLIREELLPEYRRRSQMRGPDVESRGTGLRDEVTELSSYLIA